MNIFVASWFFPPTTSSEGIVTYKLLSNSKYDYDVFCSSSRQWSYNSSMHVDKKQNIKVHFIETDSIEEWQQWVIEQFEILHQKQHYDCIMTRSTPPESIVIGREIKKKYPEIKWIASLADPVANNPYELKAYIEDNPNLSDKKKKEFVSILKQENLYRLEKLENRHESGIKLLAKLKRWEKDVLDKADLIISPTATQLRYITNGKWLDKFFALPHSFDKTFYVERQIKYNENKKKICYIGFSDALRSLKPIVYAVKKMREDGDSDIDLLDIRFIGNIPDEIKDMVMDYYLYDIIKCLPSVNYYDSLKIMQESDWLIHVDAFFPQIESGGSIFFAGKIADYMGAEKPILALTGSGSPAENIVKQYGGICCNPNDIGGIIDALKQIIKKTNYKINKDYKEKYDSVNVAARFDDKISDIINNNHHKKYVNWSPKPQNYNEKILTICVPSYNVSKYLHRCLTSLIDYDLAGYTEVLVIDDGSQDNTASIAQEFIQKYEGIVYLYQKENGGHGSTINFAISKARGRYFRVVDGDDWIDSQKLNILINNILEKNISVDVISSNYHEIDIDSLKIRKVTQEEDIEYYKVYSLEELNVKNLYFTLASMMIKTSILKQMNVLLQEHTFYVDVEFILYPVPYINQVMFTPEFIYKYARGNEEQSVALPNMVKRYDHHTRVLKRVIEYEKNINLNNIQKEYYDAILNRLLLTQYALGLVYDQDKERGYNRIKEFDKYLLIHREDLYKRIPMQMRLISRARRWKFDYKKTMKDPLVILYRICSESMSLFRKIINILFESFLGKKIKENIIRIAPIIIKK